MNLPANTCICSVISSPHIHCTFALCNRPILNNRRGWNKHIKTHDAKSMIFDDIHIDTPQDLDIDAKDSLPYDIHAIFSNTTCVVRLCNAPCDDNNESHRHCPICSRKCETKNLYRHISTHKQARIDKTTASPTTYSKLPCKPLNIGKSLWAVRSSVAASSYITHVDLSSKTYMCENRLCNQKLACGAVIECNHVASAKSNMSLEYVPFTLSESDIIDWPHSSKTEKTRLLRHATICGQNGIQLILEMDRSSNATKEHYSIATIGTDGDKSFHRLAAVADLNTSPARLKLLTPKDLSNQSFYISLLQIYRWKMGYSAIAVHETESTQKKQIKIQYDRYLEWMINNRTYSLSEQLLTETMYETSYNLTISKCPCCTNEDLRTQFEVVPLSLSDFSVKKISIKKSMCPGCRITFHNLDSRRGFIEVNGNGYSIKLLNALTQGSINNGQFRSSFRNLQIGSTTFISENDCLIAMRLWQDLTEFEIHQCPECGDHPPMLMADVSGKHCIDIDETPVQELDSNYFSKGVIPACKINYKEHWVKVKKSRMIQAITRNEEVRSLFKMNPTYLQAGWVVNPSILEDQSVWNTAWKKRYNLSKVASSESSSSSIYKLDHWSYCDLLQYLQNLTKSKLVKFASKCKLKLSTKLTVKESIKTILALHPSSKNDPLYFKNFPLNDDISGGILCLLCTHGFIYYSKVIIGGEGCSDVADAIRIFNPKVVVYDYAAGLAAYMRGVDNTFFYQGTGLPGNNDEDFLSRIKDQALSCGDRQRSYPLLCDWNDLCAKAGSFALIDGFHIKNASQDVDRFGRDIRGIHNIPFRLNSAAQEQIWSSTAKHLKSLTQMNYANFAMQWNLIAIDNNNNRLSVLTEHKRKQTQMTLPLNKRRIALASC